MLILVCSVMFSCPNTHKMVKTNIECTYVGENNYKYLVDCTESVKKECKTANVSSEYKHEMIDKDDCIKLERR